MSTTFPALPLDSWQETRDTLRGYAQLSGKIRRAETPAQKHWWHVSLRLAAVGLATTPIPAGDLTYELLLDLTRHALIVNTSCGTTQHVPLAGQSIRFLRDETLAALDALGLPAPSIDPEEFEDVTPGAYDRTAVATFWQALSQVDSELKAFRHGFRRESSPVQLWPHHFDLAVNWFSGRLVPDQDPADPDNADEQMNFGFSTGDGGIAEPYFYATAYPQPDGWHGGPLPQGAYWQSESWSGAVLPYDAVTAAADGRALLQAFLQQTHDAGAALMID